MKYTIEGFSQKQLVAWNLDATDAVILRYVVDFYNTGLLVKETFNNQEYFWVKYQTLLDELPIVGITNKMALARRFKKYLACGLMEHYTKRKGGIYSFYRFTANYQCLITDLLAEVLVPTSRSASTPTSRSASTKDSSPKVNSSTKDKDAAGILEYLNQKTGKQYRLTTKANLSGINARLKEGTTDKNTSVYSAEFETFWNGDENGYEGYPRKIVKKAAYAKWKATLKRGVTVTELMAGARGYADYVKSKKTEEQFILHPGTFLGPNEHWQDYAKKELQRQKEKAEKEADRDFDWQAFHVQRAKEEAEERAKNAGK